MVFRACHSQVQHFMPKPMAYMLLSTGLSAKSRHLNFPSVKTLPSPQERNRKVSSQRCWSLEQTSPSSSLAPACSFWGSQTSCLGTTAQSSLPWPSLQVFGLFIHFFYRDRSTWRDTLGKRSDLNSAVQWDECFTLCQLAFIVACPFPAFALVFTLITLRLGIQVWQLRYFPCISVKTQRHNFVS